MKPRNLKKLTTMKEIYSLLSFLMMGLIMASCELNSNQTLTEQLALKGPASYGEEAGDVCPEPVRAFAEIFSDMTIAAELNAIEEGYIPEIGVEERLELLSYYEHLHSEEKSMVLFRGRPIRPGKPRPKPACPPMIISDCVYCGAPLASLTLEVYSDQPDMISSEIITEYGLLAALASTEYNEQFKTAYLTYEVVNPDLKAFVSQVIVTNGVAEGDEIVEITMEMTLAAGIFN